MVDTGGVENHGAWLNGTMSELTTIAGLFVLMSALFILCGIVGSLPA